MACNRVTQGDDVAPITAVQRLYLVGDAVKPTGYLMVEGVAQSVNQFLDLLDAIEQGETEGPLGAPQIRRRKTSHHQIHHVTPPPPRYKAIRWLWEAPGNSHST